MGTAKVWVDDDADNGIVLNGTWASRTSQTDISSLRMTALCGSSCRAKPKKEQHRVHVQRVSGRKFKLLLLEVC